MRIALDYNDTITAWPNELRHLALTFMAGGGEVYIVSACYPHNAEKTRDAIRNAGINCTAVRIVPFTDYDTVPTKKVAVFKELGVEMIFDDNKDVVLLALVNGIMGVLVQGRSQRSVL